MIYAIGAEGHGDVAAIPALVGVLQEVDPTLNITQCSNPMRVGGLGTILRHGAISRYSQHAKNRGAEALVIIVDCDEGDCAACEEKIKTALEREYIPDEISVSIALIVREWEAMFLTCVEEIADKTKKVKFRPDVENRTDADAESIRDAKGVVSRMMDGSSYVERLHQPYLTACIDAEIFSKTSNAKRLLAAFRVENQ